MLTTAQEAWSGTRASITIRISLFNTLEIVPGWHRSRKRYGTKASVFVLAVLAIKGHLDHPLIFGEIEHHEADMMHSARQVNGFLLIF